MPKIRFSEQFINDVAKVRESKKRAEIRKFIDLLEDLPEIGSANLPDSIISEYGDNVRRLVVNPFLIVYEYEKDSDLVNVLGLIHAKQAW